MKAHTDIHEEMYQLLDRVYYGVDRFTQQPVTWTVVGIDRRAQEMILERRKPIPSYATPIRTLRVPLDYPLLKF